MKKTIFFVIFMISFSSLPLMSQVNLQIEAGDLHIEQDLSGGYHLWISKKPDIQSILITESSRDPENKVASYALRNPSYHPVNGDEKRLLDGEFLDNTKGLYSLIDSTPETHATYGDVFHFYIPYIIEYGYSWTRNGRIQVMDGTFLNLRTFAKPYGDYTGVFLDNPFQMAVVQKSFSGPAEDNFMPEALKSFKDIALKGKGDFLTTSGKDDLIKKIDESISGEKGKSLDLVLSIDTTKSMRDDLPYIQKAIGPLLEKHTKRFERFRVGLVFYRDYGELYITQHFPFEERLEVIQRMIGGINVSGGRDIPEAVYEALYDSIRYYFWEAESRLIILIGDAPPHPEPRGMVTAEMVYRKAEEFAIKITTIILPQ